ncbi:hypothetical protein ACVXZY_02925 [Staphylococcus aureus]
MIQTLVNFFRTKEVRNKIFFTLAMLVIFKIGTYIPAPGVNPAAFDNPQGSQGATELLNTFGGGALKRFSIFAMGYCTLHHCINRNAIITNGYCP